MHGALVYFPFLHLFVEITPDESVRYKDIRLFKMCNEEFVKMKLNEVAAVALFVETISSGCLVGVQEVHLAL